MLIYPTPIGAFMPLKSRFVLLLIIAVSLSNLAMGHRADQYDEEAREQERQAKLEGKEEHHSRNPLKNIAGGVKQATVDNARDVVSETASETSEDPVTGPLEGARKSTGKVLDNTVKGTVKVVTLGYADTTKYEVVEPEQGKDDTTKVRFHF